MVDRALGWHRVSVEVGSAEAVVQENRPTMTRRYRRSDVPDDRRVDVPYMRLTVESSLHPDTKMEIELTKWRELSGVPHDVIPAFYAVNYRDQFPTRSGDDDRDLPGFLSWDPTAFDPADGGRYRPLSIELMAAPGVKIDWSGGRPMDQPFATREDIPLPFMYALTVPRTWPPVLIRRTQEPMSLPPVSGPFDTRSTLQSFFVDTNPNLYAALFSDEVPSARTTPTVLDSRILDDEAYGGFILRHIWSRFLSVLDGPVPALPPAPPEAGVLSRGKNPTINEAYPFNRTSPWQIPPLAPDHGFPDCEYLPRAYRFGGVEPRLPWTVLEVDETLLGVTITSPYCGQQLSIEVDPRSENARFAYQFHPAIAPYCNRKLVSVLKTTDVTARLSPIEGVPARPPSLELDQGRSWFDIRDVAFENVPYPGEAFELRGSMPKADIETTENWRHEAIQLTFDLAIGFIPLVGDAVDVGEFVLAMTRDVDKWGQPVGTLDKVLLGIGAVLPFVSVRAPRRFGGFGGRQASADRLLDGLSRANLTAEERALLQHNADRVAAGLRLTAREMNEIEDILRKLPSCST